jgi:hypothetical protein
MINVIMGVKFCITICSQIFYRIGLEYRGLAEVVIGEHYMSFPGEEYNSKECHLVGCYAVWLL